MTRARLLLVMLLAVAISASAQVDGRGLPGVSAVLVRLFGTNTAFTAQAEVQVFDAHNRERLGLPMQFSRLNNHLRVEVDMARLRNREQSDTLTRLKPLGMDQVVSILRPDQRTTHIAFPKLQAVVKLEMPAEEADAFVKPAKMTGAVAGREKMAGYACVKQRVIITDHQGKKHETTVWNAPELRNFPVCVATREGADTVVMRFRQVQFVRPDAAKFEPPAGYTGCADMQALMTGPVVKYMTSNKTATPVVKKPTAPAPTTKPKSGAGAVTKKK